MTLFDTFEQYARGTPCETLTCYGMMLIVLSLMILLAPEAMGNVWGFSACEAGSRHAVIRWTATLYLGFALQCTYAGRCQSNTFAKASVIGRFLTSFIIVVLVQCGAVPFRLSLCWVPFEVSTAIWTHLALQRYYKERQAHYSVYGEIYFLVTGDVYGETYDADE